MSEIKIFGATRGLNGQNEDAVLISPSLAAVFDGAGRAGRIADKLKRVPSNEDLRAWVGQLHSHCLGFGFECCVLAAKVSGDSLHVASAGDCRLYMWYPDGRLELTVSQKTPRLGASGISPLFLSLPVVPKAIAILLSDGVWTGFSEYQLQKLVRANVLSVPELAERILAAVGQTDDDKSAVIIQC